MPIRSISTNDSDIELNRQMIPKIFHQIWINPDKPALPEKFAYYRDTWLAKHPGWKYRLWNLENIDFELRCRSLLPQCQHPAQMADLLRMEILHHHGGVYLDTDFECLKNIEQLLKDCTGFVVSEDGRHFSIGVIGASVGAPWLNRIVESYPHSLGHQPVNLETGPVFFTRVLLERGMEPGVAIFDSKLFYPFNYHTVNRDSIDLSQSYAVHHYADSWKKPLPAWKKLLQRIRRK